MTRRADPSLAAALAADLPAPDGAPPGWERALAWLAGDDSGLAELPGELALAAIEAACRRDDADRLQSLASSRDRGLRKAARAALHRLRARGIRPAAELRGRAYTLGASTSPFPSRAFLLAEGPPCTNLIIDQLVGGKPLVLDISLGIPGSDDTPFCVHLSRSATRSLWRSLERDDDAIEIDWSLGLALLALHRRITGRLEAEVQPECERFWRELPQPTRAAGELLDPLRGFPDPDDLPQMREDEIPPLLPYPAELIDELAEELTRIIESPLEIGELARAGRFEEALRRAALELPTRLGPEVAADLLVPSLIACRAVGSEALLGTMLSTRRDLLAGVSGDRIPAIRRMIQVVVRETDILRDLVEQAGLPPPPDGLVLPITCMFDKD